MVSMADLGKFRIAGGESEGQGVEDERVGAQAVVVNSDVINPFGNFQFTGSRLGHAVFINGQDDHSRVVCFGQRKNLIGFGTTGFKMSRIDETASGGGLERHFEYIQFGSVDYQWNFNAHFQFLDRFAHQFHFVGALGDGAGDIKSVRAKIDLLAGDF